jgi:hypothetical protein
VEFESWFAFYKSSSLIQFNMEQTLIIPLNDIEELEEFSKIIKETRIADKTMLYIKLTPELLIDFVNKNLFEVYKKSFDIILNKTDEIILKELYQLNNNFGKWSTRNRMWFEFYINKDNYKTELNDIITLFLNTNIRFFKLHFDFLSFEKMNLGELHEFNYHIQHIFYWQMSSADKKQGMSQLELYPFGWCPTLFVDENLNLYVNRIAFEEKDVLFKLGEHLNDDGESLSVLELESLRVYMDIQEHFLMPSLRSPRFMDFYQNKKVMGHYNEIPKLNLMINELFGGFSQ